MKLIISLSKIYEESFFPPLPIRKMVRFPLLSILSLVSNYSVIIYESSSPSINPSKVKQVSWSPRAFVYEGFLTDQECNHLISLAESELKRSVDTDNESGEGMLSEVSGMFIPKGKDPIIAGIEDKIALWTFLPIENGEEMQVWRYKEGQRYDPYYDYIIDKENTAQGGHRIVTVIMYLSNVTTGGETMFPAAEESPHSISSPSDDNVSGCAKKGLSVKPQKGNALIFFDRYPNAIPDPSSLLGGCPVIEGENWLATKWIYDKSLESASKDCTDENENCERWAASGECSRNPQYMVGTRRSPGYCRRSCQSC